MFLHQPVKYTQYVDNVTEYQYKEHLPDVAQSFWDIHSLTSRYNPTSSCSQKNTLPTSLNDISESSVNWKLTFSCSKLTYSGTQKNQSIFTKVESILQHTNTSLLVIEKCNSSTNNIYLPTPNDTRISCSFLFQHLLRTTGTKTSVGRAFQSATRHGFWKFCCAEPDLGG